jgi:hypothetical protein
MGWSSFFIGVAFAKSSRLGRVGQQMCELVSWPAEVSIVDWHVSERVLSFVSVPEYEMTLFGGS